MAAYNLEFLEVVSLSERGPTEEREVEPLELSLNYYRTSIEDVYVFYWSPVKYRKIFSQYSWELQIDTIPTFNSPNLRTYTEWNVRSYQNGQMVKGYEIEVFPRSETQETFYWRVKPYLSIKDSVYIGESGLIENDEKYLFLTDVTNLSELVNRLVDRRVNDSISLSDEMIATKN